MKEQKNINILWKYLWQYRFIGLVFLLFIGIFTGIFSLYRLEIEAIIYAAVLCAFSAAVLVLNHFFFYIRKHRTLKNICKNIEFLEAGVLKPSHLIEEDLCDIILALQKMNQNNLNAWKEESRDSMDYYTTWVHQIKAPIAVMRLLLQSHDNSENRKLLAELFRVEQYAQMALSYARLDSNSTDFILHNINLDSVIRQAIRKFAPQFVHKKIALQYERTDIKVLTDEKWLLFILEQLLSNAVKYTEKGSVTITVNDEKIIKITDTGIGIASEDLPRIFEKGFTGYNGHANKKSTGLGLYLCMRAAKQLSHTLDITSCERQGTTVALNLNHEILEVE